MIKYFRLKNIHDMIQTVFNDDLQELEEKLRDFQQATQVKYNAVIQKLKEDGVDASVLNTFTLNQCLSAHDYQ